MEKKINKNLVFSTILIIIFICFLIYKFNWEYPERNVFIGIGLGLLSGYFIEILKIKARISGKEIWRIVIFCLLIAGLFFTQVISLHIFWGYFITLCISYTMCYSVTRYLKENE